MSHEVLDLLSGPRSMIFGFPYLFCGYQQGSDILLANWSVLYVIQVDFIKLVPGMAFTFNQCPKTSFTVDVGSNVLEFFLNKFWFGIIVSLYHQPES